MKLALAYLDAPESDKMGARYESFGAMMAHLDEFQDGYIIETGCARQPENFDGDGMSTFWWEFVQKHKPFLVHSVDINADAVKFARETFTNVTVHHMDSVQFLHLLNDEILGKTRLLYLDSFDWSHERHLESSFHHMMELATVYAKLPPGCMVVVDDRHTENLGKHFMVDLFFQKLGIPPKFIGYQIGWIKP